MTAIWMGNKQKGETVSQSEQYRAFFPAFPWAHIQKIQAYDYVIVPEGKYVGGHLWYQVFQLNFNI